MIAKLLCGVWLKRSRYLHSWNVGPEKPYRITLAPLSNNLVVASRTIKVYSIETEELVQTFTGHTSEVNYMDYVVSNKTTEYVLTTSRLERIICLWKIGKKGRNKTSSCTLLMEDIAHCLSSQIYEDDSSLRVAV